MTFMGLVSIRNVSGTHGLDYDLHTISVMQIMDTGNAWHLFYNITIRILKTDLNNMATLNQLKYPCWHKSIVLYFE